MYHLKHYIELCEPQVREDAKKALRVLCKEEGNRHMYIAENLYVACKQQQDERGYLKKSEPRYAKFFEDRYDEEDARYDAMSSLHLEDCKLDKETEEKLCDVFHALSGHESQTQKKIASTLVEKVEEAVAALKRAEDAL